MNDRIKELLAQAISDVDYIHFDDAIDEELSQMYIPDVFAERFAELIIRECISVVKADGDHWEKLSHSDLDRGQAPYRDCMLYAAYRLKEDAVWSIEEHFGLDQTPVNYGEKE